ncbi:protein-L-isoaspartate(D-aspartate) O-methyltransferase [Bacteroidales bacterium OttesenSCG-928-I21]|nr:protein-L-isoaspartate(D-aspartate) O-methyltransferase [Bacteroidales bacterium OttesenSCG-928-I21]
MNDLKYVALRKKLVEELKTKGIKDEKVLAAIGKVPRHLFMDPTTVNFAYVDNAYKIAAGQTISQPYTVAFQTELLEILPGDKVLEIGTGSGYQCAVLCELGAEVYSIERQDELFTKTFKLLHKLGYRPKLAFRDGFEGWEGYDPFDKIIVTAAAPEVPPKLLEQLDINGFLVIPVGEGNRQEMLRIKKISDNEFVTEKFGSFSFVPMLEGTN